MLRVTDKREILGPLTDPRNPLHCLRCDQDLYYECDGCKTILGSAPPAVDCACDCGQSPGWSGPKCICNNCDCRLD